MQWNAIRVSTRLNNSARSQCNARMDVSLYDHVTQKHTCPNLSDLYLIEYHVWGVVERKTCLHPKSTMQQLHGMPPLSR